MNNIILILARKNSKRLKNKNLKKVKNNKKLIDYTLETARQIKKINDIIISTDNKTLIKHINENYKFIKVLERPNYLSRDNTTSFASAKHAINWYEKNIAKINNIILLQPTSPFRNLTNINRKFNIFCNEDALSLASVSPIKFNKKTLNKNNLIINKNYFINGNFYFIKKNSLLKNKSFVNNYTKFTICNSFQESIDIDTIKDWINFKKII